MLSQINCNIVCSLAFAAISLSALAPCHAAPALTLAQAQRIARDNAPQLQAQSAAVRAVEAAGISASEFADPKLIVGLDNLPLDGADRFNIGRDFMTMRKIGFMQEFTRSDKLKLRGDRADAEIRKENALLALAQVTLQRDVALAWIDRHFAERQLDMLRELAREAELQVSAAQATLAGGKGQATDPFAARLAVAQLADRITDAERLVARSQSQLARWIGDAAKLPLDPPPAFDKLARRHEDLIGGIDSLPHLAMYAPLQAIAEADVRLAHEAKHPDWSLEVAYAQRGPAFSNMLSIGVRIDLPIFQSRRQDPAIAAKTAVSEQVRAQTEDARRSHIAEFQSLAADWESGKKRLQRYQADLLPLAHERSEVALAAYRGGRSDLAMVLEARKGEIETRLNHLQAQGDLARAWANLNFLLPDTKDSQ